MNVWHADCAISGNISWRTAMKRTLVFAATFAAFLALSGSAQAAHRSIGLRVSFGAFYRPLAAYGQWIEVDPGVVVWRPVHVRPGWRPYMEGRWVWSDYGWYWVSSEPFGWATFHYGRWYYDDYYGWVWMPDDVWGPAWVEWRYNDSYIGWAPLPPYASFHIAFGIRFTRTWIAPHDYWCFVDYHRFGSTIRYRDYVTPDHSRRLIGTTRGGAGYEIDRNRVVNRGVDRTFIEQRSGSTVERTEIRAGSSERGERFIRGTDRQNIVETYRPSASDFERSETPRTITHGERRLNIEMDKVERPQRSTQSLESPRRNEQTTEPGRTRSQPGRTEEFKRPSLTPSTTQPSRQPSVRKEQEQQDRTVTQPGRTAPRVKSNTPSATPRRQPERATPPTPSRKPTSQGETTRRRN